MGLRGRFKNWERYLELYEVSEDDGERLDAGGFGAGGTYAPRGGAASQALPDRLTIVIMDEEMERKVLTPQRLKLLRTLRRRGVGSISELAAVLRRLDPDSIP